MAIVDATSIPVEKFRSVRQLRSFRFTIPSVAAGVGVVSDEFRSPLTTNEISLLTFRIACLSTKYDISLRTKAGVVLPSINEILQVSDIDLNYQESDLRIVASNSDVPEGKDVYLVITNKDPVNATGIIEYELIISRM